MDSPRRRRRALSSSSRQGRPAGWRGRDRQTGVSGETDPFHRPKGTPFLNTCVGSFEASHGKFVRLDRPCIIQISRLTPPPAENALELATTPESWIPAATLPKPKLTREPAKGRAR